ncbi:katanin p60 ATPase-containing subunit A-like 2 [Xenia sp. Carnegie-2017]|uniref:katanin p60 ATPase-containing subunit A-like 2 n=1 Tax=Xenia sp. Carnegie-2017 TaxID=2897299 RepID=UPI001F036CA1|nr:katanin p60 ATPase-containing subunit A-like 2 [Xenia sp. Carnegie-2017]
MAKELSYMQLKTANEARQSDEQRSEFRKKEILVLVLGYLTDQGYLDTVKTLQNESGLSLENYSVCDNIDLPAILQEYESYYNVKFKKFPKFIKKIQRAINSKSAQGLQSKVKLKNRGSSCSLPNINAHKLENETFTPHSPSNSTQKASLKASVVKTKSLTTIDQDKLTLVGNSLSNEHIAKDTLQTVQNIHGKNVIIDMKALLTNAVKCNDLRNASDSTDKLLKPLAGFAGLTGEWRELAAVISRDIYLDNPDVYWNDIVGLESAKRLVKEAIVYPIKYPQLFSGILSPWKGLLLYGPPGTGKTLLAKAVATECNTTFFNISASTIVSKWRGDSEKLVRVLFELARFHAPSTIFLDELESLMSQRGAGSTGDHEGSRRMKTELLIQMDGLAKSSDLVFLLAASNLPWELDHAMLRRLEKRILVNLPSEEARKQMLKNLMPPLINSRTNGLDLKTEIDYDFFAKELEGYSGSDINLLCKEAAMRPLRKVFDILENDDGEKPNTFQQLLLNPVTNEDMQSALSTTKPSARRLHEKYAKWQMEYESV